MAVIGSRKASNDTTSGVEQVYWVGGIHNHVALKPEGSQDLGLRLRTSLSKLNKSISSKAVHVLLEFTALKISQFFGFLNLKLLKLPQAHKIKCDLFFLKSELRLL
jgi:hypothetical protein